MFDRIATSVSEAAGSPWATGGAVLAVLLWALAGPYLGFSEAWQLAINTGTTITTFLMVFLIQASQNQDDRATQAKLDELLRVSRAHNDLIDAEHQPKEEVERKKRRAKGG